MEEEIIMPDDFQEETTAQPQADDITQQQIDVEGKDTNQTNTQQEETQTEVKNQDTPKIKIKFNHEERELTHDEAAPLVQKGLNYDKLQEKFNTLQSDPRLSKYEKIQQLADAYGMADDDLLDALYNQYYDQVAKNQGLTPEQVKKEHELKQREQSLNQKEQSNKTKQQEQDMYAKFLQNFPNAKVEEIKPETWIKVQNGMDLSSAYIEQRNQDLESRIKAFEQNEKNAKKAPVTGVTTHGSKEVAEEDDFLKGFNSF